MKKIILIAALMVAGCAHKDVRPDVGVAPPAKMPELPQTLRQKAERLPDLADRSLGGLHRDGISTDTRYNDLAYRYNAIVDAWGCVRETLNARSTTNLATCFGAAEETNKQ